MFICPGCKARFRVARAPKGGRIKCPKCGQVSVLKRKTPAGPAAAPSAAAPTAASAPPPPGLAPDATIAGHKIVEYLGGGQFTAAYKASQTSMGRTVLLKALRPPYAADASTKERFFAGARGAARLNHPNLLSVFDMGEEGDVCFYTTEFVEGGTLPEFINREEAVSSETRLAIATQIAQALAYAESSGVEQAWLGPDDVLLTDKEDVRVGRMGTGPPLGGGEPEPIMTVLARLMHVTATGRDLPSETRVAGGAVATAIPSARDALGNRFNAAALRLINEGPDAYGSVAQFAAELEKLSEGVQRRSTVDASAPGGVVPLHLERAHRRELPIKGILIATVICAALLAIILVTVLSTMRGKKQAAEARDLWADVVDLVKSDSLSELKEALDIAERLAKEYPDTQEGKLAREKGIDDVKHTMVAKEYARAEADFKKKPRERAAARAAIQAAQERLHEKLRNFPAIDKLAKDRLDNADRRYQNAAAAEWKTMLRAIKGCKNQHKFGKALAKLDEFKDKWPETDKPKEWVTKGTANIHKLAAKDFEQIIRQVHDLLNRDNADDARTKLNFIIDSFPYEEYPFAKYTTPAKEVKSLLETDRDGAKRKLQELVDGFDAKKKGAGESEPTPDTE